MATDVKIIRHDLKNGRTSLSLAFYPPFFDCRTGKMKRTENLHMWLVTKPKNATEKKYNAEIEELAFSVMAQRIVQIKNEDFGFLDKSIKKESFLDFFKEQVKQRPKWMGCFRQFNAFCGGVCTFGNLSVPLCERFREYLLTQAVNRRTGKLLNQNSAAGYMITFRTLIKKAYIAHLIDTNLNDYFKSISYVKTQKDYLTADEVKRLAATPCKIDVLKRASMFSIFTGLRFSDLMDLEWSQIVRVADGGWGIRKKIQKTQRWEDIFISEEALEWCGPRGEGKVFKRFTKSMTQHYFYQWLEAAGITDTKHVTFHCLRHTNATLMLGQGIDIYTVSHMLTHQNVQTTQVYTEVIDQKRRAAANAITLKK